MVLESATGIRDGASPRGSSRAADRAAGARVPPPEKDGRDEPRRPSPEVGADDAPGERAIEVLARFRRDPAQQPGPDETVLRCDRTVAGLASRIRWDCQAGDRDPGGGSPVYVLRAAIEPENLDLAQQIEATIRSQFDPSSFPSMSRRAPCTALSAVTTWPVLLADETSRLASSLTATVRFLP